MSLFLKTFFFLFFFVFFFPPKVFLDAAVYLRSKIGVISCGGDCVREMSGTHIHRVSVGLRVMASEDGKERPNGRVPISISYDM